MAPLLPIITRSILGNNGSYNYPLLTTPTCRWCARPTHVGDSGASVGPGLSSSSPRQWESDGRVKIYNSVSARSPLTKSKKEKIRERSNIKSARVSALTGSVPRKMAEALQRVLALCTVCRNRTHVARLFATSLNQSAIGSYQMFQKNSIPLVVFRHLQPIFWRTGLLC